MKILAVSDKALNRVYASNVRERYPDVDLIIGCGDLPYYYLEFLASGLHAPLYYVLGNHDQGPQYTADGRVLTGVQGGRNIHGRVVREGKIILAGLEGSIRYRPQARLMYTQHEMIWEAMRLVPKLLHYRVRFGRAVDILVTHSPPFGIHDRQDSAHIGFKVFRPLLRLFRPRYLLHGHVHARQGKPSITEFHQTKIINVYPLYLFNYAEG